MTTSSICTYCGRTGHTARSCRSRGDATSVDPRRVAAWKSDLDLIIRELDQMQLPPSPSPASDGKP